MDPVSTVGAAAASIKLLDFGINLFGAAKEISTSTDGLSKNQQSILSIASHLDSLLKEHAHSLKRLEESSGKPANDLYKICQQCHKKAEELRRAVTAVGATGASPSIWPSLWSALKSVLNEAKVRGLVGELEVARTQLHTALLICLWDETKKDYGAIGQMQQKVDTVIKLLSRDEPADNKTSQSAPAIRVDTKNSDYQKFGVDIASCLWDDGWRCEPAELSGGVLRDTCEPDLKAFRVIVQSLQFDDAEKRHGEIPEAHANTLRWIWDRHPPLSDSESRWSSFPAWLEADDVPFYSIIGKPGSGKSTLMKYIQHHPQLRTHLKCWTPHRGLGRVERETPVRVLSFYAWHPGSGFQKSLDGLRRTILVHGLYQDPSLLPKVAPLRWAFHTLTRGMVCPREWDAGEVEEALSIFLTEHAARVKLLILIDGLDEFAAPPAEVLDVIAGISRHAGGCVKICVACRPWYEYRDYFIGFPSLTMHLLTHNDLELYIADKLHACPAFHERRAEAGGLQTAVLAKSDGVFLWVSVVTNFLTESLQRGDTEVELRVVVDNLPSEMSELYDNIWNRVPQSFRDAALRLFFLLEASYCGRLLFPELWVIDEHSGHSQTGSSPELTRDALESIRRTISRRLQSRTHGLLEILPNHGIGYLHRTAHDWTRQRMLTRDDDQRCQRHSVLLYTFVLLSRWCPYANQGQETTGLHYLNTMVDRSFSSWRQYITYCVLFHALQVFVDPRTTSAQLENLGAWLGETHVLAETVELPSWTLETSDQTQNPAPRFLDVASSLSLTPLFVWLSKEDKKYAHPERVLDYAIFPPGYGAIARLLPRGPGSGYMSDYLQYRDLYLQSALFRPADRLKIIQLCLAPLPNGMDLKWFQGLRRKVERFVHFQVDIDTNTDEALVSYLRQVLTLLREAEVKFDAGKRKSAMRKLGKWLKD